MPPKIKLKKEALVAAALDLVRDRGADALNARELARRLDCSTQPLFSNYVTMEELRSDVIPAAKKCYQKYLEEGMKGSRYPPYKASGIACIRFAREEKELFRLLFMRDRTTEKIVEKKEALAPLLEIISTNNGIGKEDAYLFHLEMWIFVHGIATMAATSGLE